MRVALRHLADNAIKYQRGLDDHHRRIARANRRHGRSHRAQHGIPGRRRRRGAGVRPVLSRRAVEEHRRQRHGVGIVGQIARAHGGDVALEADVSGTSFPITLPRGTP